MTKFLFSTFCCCILYFSAFAQVVNGIEYTVKETTATVVSMSPRYSGNINIPSTIVYRGKSYTVTRIGNGAFNKCTDLTSITLPNTITSIGNNAFRGCTRLSSITLPNTITSIENNTFKGCTRLTSITLPNTITSIGKSAFSECTRLTSVTLSNNLTSIGKYAFYQCTNLSSITLPNNLRSIGDYAFWGCEKLTPVVIPNSVNVGFSAFPANKVKPISEYAHDVITLQNSEQINDAKPIEEFKRCPYCGEEILAVAIKCKHCGEWLDKTTTSKVEFKPKKGSFCIEVQFRPLGDIVIQSNPIGLGSAGISAKCFVAKKSELRLDLLFGFSSGKGDSPRKTVSNTAFGLNFGLNRHFNGTERISPYIGFLLGFGVDNQNVKTNSSDTASGDYTLVKTGNFGMNFIVPTGFNWYIVKGLYIGAEVGLGIGFEKELKEVTKKSTGGEITTTTKNPDPPAANFGVIFFATPAIRLGWKF